MMKSHGTRGQALAETALCFPVLMASFAFLIWCCQYATVAERVELTTRQASEIFSANNTYDQYSLPALYDAMYGGAVVYENFKCPTPSPVILDSPTASANAVSITRSTFFMSKPNLSACGSGDMVVTEPTRTYVMSFTHFAWTSPLSFPLFNLQTASAPIPTTSLDNFGAASLYHLYNCYIGDYGEDVKESLLFGSEGTNDPTPVNGWQPTAQDVNDALPVNTLTISGTCN